MCIVGVAELCIAGFRAAPWNIDGLCSSNTTPPCVYPYPTCCLAVLPAHICFLIPHSVVWGTFKPVPEPEVRRTRASGSPFPRCPSSQPPPAQLSLVHGRLFFGFPRMMTRKKIVPKQPTKKTCNNISGVHRRQTFWFVNAKVEGSGIEEGSV